MPEKANAAPAATVSSIVEFSKTEAALADLRQRYKDIVVDCSTRDGMQVAIKGRAELRGFRVTLEKTRVDLKAPVLERGRLIDAEAARITAELLAMEEPLDALIKVEENRKEQERLAKEEEERKRIASITTRIEHFGAAASSFVGRPPADIAKRLDELRAETVGEWAGEFKATAENARLRAVAALEQLHAGAIALQKQREEEARLAAEREAELTRLRREKEARDREEEQRRIADQQRILAEGKARAEADAAHKARIDAEERASREKREAEDRAHRERMAKDEAEARAKREAEEARLRIEREAREADERKAREARAAEDARLEADRQRIAEERRELERRQAELLDGRARLASFVEKFGGVKEFAGIARAIGAFLKEVQPAAVKKEAA
jgi:colicin import membrane protein